MKKFIYLLTGVAVASAMQSCVDTEKPVFQEPTSFTINAPALQNEYLATTADMDNKSTFTLYASQPDYGFAAQANYNVQVCLSSDFVDATDTQDANYVVITNQNITSGEMTFKTYDLAVAMTKLLGFDEESTEEDYQKYLDEGGKTVMPVYFRAVCEIPGVPASYIVSSNVVSYNQVQFSFAVPKAGFIYYVGDTVEVGATWKEPSSGNADFYQNWMLVEPEIGSKIYAATFTLPGTASIKTLDPAKPQDYTTQFRFFTELSGWADGSKMVGSNEADFYVQVITNDFEDGQYKGDAVYGKGNWGIFLDNDIEMTMAVSLVDVKKPKVWFRYGKWDVSVAPDANGINEPVFSAPAE